MRVGEDCDEAVCQLGRCLVRDPLGRLLALCSLLMLLPLVCLLERPDLISFPVLY